jgi:hypothetical protein
MYVIGHEYVSVNVAAVLDTRLGKLPKIGAIVLVTEEAWHSIVAALDYVLGNAGDVEP